MLHGNRMKKLRLSHPWIHPGSAHYSSFATVSDRGAIDVELAHIKKYLAEKQWFTRVGNDADTAKGTVCGCVCVRVSVGVWVRMLDVCLRVCPRGYVWVCMPVRVCIWASNPYFLDTETEDKE